MKRSFSFFFSTKDKRDTDLKTLELNFVLCVFIAVILKRGFLWLKTANYLDIKVMCHLMLLYKTERISAAIISERKA